jgi:hypothetical protein
METVSMWELEKLRAPLSIGDNALPLGVALKMAIEQAPTPCHCRIMSDVVHRSSVAAS